MVGLEVEIIDKDFRQSCWLALQFWVQPNRIFTVGVPQASHGISTRCTAIAKSDCFKEGAAKNVYDVLLFYEKMVWRETLCSKQLL